MSNKSDKGRGGSSSCGDRYAAERYDPSLAHCSSLSLRFDGSRLILSGGSKEYRYPAVSGRPDASGAFDYSQARQRLGGTGAIPEGIYWINPDELWERGWAWDVYGLVNDSHQRAWGDYRITIHPFTTTQTFCRGGFFIHGGAVSGSAGCIDLTSHMAKFVGDLRAENAQRKCQIHLSVDYP